MQKSNSTVESNKTAKERAEAEGLMLNGVRYVVTKIEETSREIHVRLVRTS
jgi:hypothetical protein